MVRWFGWQGAATRGARSRAESKGQRRRDGRACRVGCFRSGRRAFERLETREFLAGDLASHPPAIDPTIDYSTYLGGAAGGFVAAFPAAATQNQQFIGQLYHDLLNREVDASGLAFWDAQLAAGATRVQVALGIEQTTEFKQLVINGLYLHYLHRVADAGGLEFCTQLLNQGATIEQVEALIIGSDEYFADQGGANDAFLNAVYHDALGRPIDPTGLAWWNSLLAAGQSRTQIASQILSTDEYRQRVVQLNYLRLLSRAASAAELEYWVGVLRGGASDQQVAADIAGSDEYYANAA